MKNAMSPPMPVDSPAMRVSKKASMMFSVVIFWTTDKICGRTNGCELTCKDNTNNLNFVLFMVKKRI